MDCNFILFTLNLLLSYPIEAPGKKSFGCILSLSPPGKEDLALFHGQLLNIHIFRKNQVQKQGNDENNRNNIGTENILYDRRKNLPDFNLRSRGKTDSDGQRKRRNDDVSLRESAGSHHLHTGHHNGSEHHDGTSAQNALG